MEILKHGKLHEKHLYTRSCPVCDCIFKCNQDDFINDNYYIYVGQSIFDKVACPECGSVIGIAVEMYDKE